MNHVKWIVVSVGSLFLCISLFYGEKAKEKRNQQRIDKQIQETLKTKAPSIREGAKPKNKKEAMKANSQPEPFFSQIDSFIKSDAKVLRTTEEQDEINELLSNLEAIESALLFLKDVKLASADLQKNEKKRMERSYSPWS